MENSRWRLSRWTCCGFAVGACGSTDVCGHVRMGTVMVQFKKLNFKLDER